MRNIVARWQTGVINIYSAIHVPSSDLKAIMKEEGYLWSIEKDWWVTDTQATEDKKPKVTTINTGDNIIKIDFDNKKET